MKARLDYPVIDDNAPFLNCKLGREEYGIALMNIVDSFVEGCVIALDGKWGSGKTTFVKMWQKLLEQNSFETIYYNAWENDFISDPLISLLGEINLKHVNSVDNKMEKVIASAGKILISMLPSLGKGIIKKISCIDAEEVGDIVKDGIKEYTSLLKKQITEYESQKSTMEAFKKDLSDVVEIITDNHPLVFIVDELDRCNPQFAVKVLERIKHLFSIKKIVFVLAIDKEQLSNAICGYYGSDTIDSKEYLRRFIDVDFMLPDYETKHFCEYLYGYYDFNYFLKNKERLYYFSSKQEDYNLIKFASRLTKQLKIPPRVIDRIFSNTRLTLRMFHSSDNISVGILFLLTLIRVCQLELFHCICDHSLSVQDLINNFEEYLPLELLKNEVDNNTFYYDFALLLLCYNTDDYSRDIEDVIKRGDYGEKNSIIVDFKYINAEAFNNAIDYWLTHPHNNVINLKYYTEKVNLLSKVIG